MTAASLFQPGQLGSEGSALRVQGQTVPGHAGLWVVRAHRMHDLLTTGAADRVE